ncbi:MAG: SRPBCC family protein, partial [Anaerolineales bacterium]
MFKFTESIHIEAPPADVWEYVADVERWWLASNPEHIHLDVPSPEPTVGLGSKIVFEERVAGIKGKAAGSITKWIAGTEVTWEGIANYRYLGFPLRVREGVSWRVDNGEHETQLSATVWAKFSSSLLGQLFEWYAKRIL